MSKPTNQRPTKAKTANQQVIPVKMQQISLPVFSEKVYTGQKFVRYGDDNLFPQFLQMLADRSALHGAIVTNKLNYAYGHGFEYDDSTKNILTTAWMKHPNPYETLNDIYKKCLYDYILYGAFALNVIWDADKQHIAEIYHCDVSKIRCGMKDRFGIVREYFYSDVWYKTALREYDSIPAFSITNREGSQILYYKDYRPGTSYYALPSYCGALNAIATDMEISNFHLSHILNGMSPSKSITFMDGVPSEDEQRNIKGQIESLYTGSDNAGKFLLNFVNSPEKAPKIDTLGGDNLGDEFIQLESSVLNQILAGHMVTSPLLVGLRTDNNGLGSNSDEILKAFEVFTNTVIKPIQDTVIKTFNDIIQYTKGYEGLILEPTLNIPVKFMFSEGILTQICTKNELREMIGKDPIEEVIEEEIKAE